LYDPNPAWGIEAREFVERIEKLLIVLLKENHKWARE
jgi:hypothetical protein